MTSKSVCAICKRRPNTRLNIDHDHVTGDIRGLLCPNCNRAIGLFRDDPGIMRHAAEYIEKKRLNKVALIKAGGPPSYKPKA